MAWYIEVITTYYITVRVGARVEAVFLSSLLVHMKEGFLYRITFLLAIFYKIHSMLLVQCKLKVRGKGITFSRFLPLRQGRVHRLHT